MEVIKCIVYMFAIATVCGLGYCLHH